MSTRSIDLKDQLIHNINVTQQTIQNAQKAAHTAFSAATNIIGRPPEIQPLPHGTVYNAHERALPPIVPVVIAGSIILMIALVCCAIVFGFLPSPTWAGTTDANNIPPQRFASEQAREAFNAVNAPPVQAFLENMEISAPSTIQRTIAEGVPPVYLPLTIRTQWANGVVASVLSVHVTDGDLQMTYVMEEVDNDTFYVDTTNLSDGTHHWTATASWRGRSFVASTDVVVTSTTTEN